ncbi:MAG: hypothetical protein V3V10_07195 [Planctomycetota bacterium]
MDGTNIIGSLISGGILLALGGMIAALFKVNTNLTRLNVQHESTVQRLDRLENPRKGRVSTALLVLLMFLALFVSGCSLFGLDMEQAQADAEQTASALEIINKRVPAIEASIDNIVLLYDAAIERGDFEEAKRLAVELQREVKNLELTVDDKNELTATFGKQVSAFKNAKDTRGYLQAALGLFGGVFATFFGGRGMLKRRDKIIRTTASNYDEADGDLPTLKTLQRERLDQSERDLLSKLRKG